MAKKNKKALLIGGAALAALFLYKKYKDSLEEFTPKTAVKPKAVISPITPMKQASVKLFNPVNNLLNNVPTPQKKQQLVKLDKVIVPTKKLSLNGLPLM